MTAVKLYKITFINDKNKETTCKMSSLKNKAKFRKILKKNGMKIIDLKRIETQVERWEKNHR